MALLDNRGGERLGFDFSSGGGKATVEGWHTSHLSLQSSIRNRPPDRAFWNLQNLRYSQECLLSHMFSGVEGADYLVDLGLAWLDSQPQKSKAKLARTREALMLSCIVYSLFSWGFGRNGT